jgi:hypothetical protein
MADIASLTTAVLRGENRRITTRLAEHVRHRVLDDGSHAHGIHFGSKHGAYWCKAAWMDEQHNPPGALMALSPDPILVTDSDLERVANRFRIRVF